MTKLHPLMMRETLNDKNSIFGVSRRETLLKKFKSVLVCVVHICICVSYKACKLSNMKGKDICSMGLGHWDKRVASYFIYEITICWELAISAPQLAWHARSICYTQWFVKHENRRLEKHLTCKPSNNAQFKTLVQFMWVLLTLVWLSQTGKLVLEAQTIFCNINMFISAF